MSSRRSDRDTAPAHVGAPTGPRAWWWATLDYFEGARHRRVLLGVAGVLLVAGLAGWHWALPVWQRRNAIRIAHQWLEAGNLRNAADAAQRAANLAPGNPEPWVIFAELARLGGQQADSLRYARRAAEIDPLNPDLVIGLAAAELRAGHSPEAARTLRQLPADVRSHSAAAQRVEGELARRELRNDAARDCFERAVQLEGALPVNEIPLATVLLQSTDPAVRERALRLLARHAGDPVWGITALRLLVGDAVDHRDPASLTRWADPFRQHPLFAGADMSLYLLALLRSDEARYASVVAGLKRDHAISPAAAAQLLGWWNEIGRSEESVAWLRTLPADRIHRPPLAALGAEALRATARWAELREWCAAPDWTGDTEFLRWVYGWEAARQVGDSARADELLRTLLSHAQLDTGHGLFAASTLYAWGRPEPAEKLWWRAAEQEGTNAVAALGSLARHYQVSRDPAGQYRAFRRWHLLQPGDPDVANNFAFFALLTDREQRLAEDLARRNVATDPANDAYVATLAFALVQQHQAEEALRLLEARPARTQAASPLAFSYGLALAANGRRDEARALLGQLPDSSLTTAEVELIRTRLAP